MLTLHIEELFLKVARKFHLDSTSSSNDSLSLDSSDNNHESIVEGSLSFLNVLRSSTSQNDSDSLGSGTASEHVVAFVTELYLLELVAVTENLLIDTVSGGLHDSTDGLGSSLEIVDGATSSAENISVSEILSG